MRTAVVTVRFMRVRARRPLIEILLFLGGFRVTGGLVIAATITSIGRRIGSLVAVLLPDFLVAFPITLIDSLSEIPSGVESFGFPNSSNLVLDARRKVFVKPPSKGGVVPRYLGTEAIEFDNVFGNVVIVAHNEILDCIFGIGLGVVRSEIPFKFLGELLVVVVPSWFGNFA